MIWKRVKPRKLVAVTIILLSSFGRLFANIYLLITKNNFGLRLASYCNVRTSSMVVVVTLCQQPTSDLSSYDSLTFVLLDKETCRNGLRFRPVAIALNMIQIKASDHGCRCGYEIRINQSDELSTSPVE
jgi:hypothetical protein